MQNQAHNGNSPSLTGQNRCIGKTVLSLFDYSGNWSKPYFEAGANVIQVDIKLGMDVMAINADWLNDLGVVDGILAAPPCTDFAVSGAQYWTKKDEDGRTQKSLELVRQVLRCVDFCQPDWWAMENPVGRLNNLMPELCKYGPWYFNPCDYGDPYTKKTGIWGDFVPPLPLFIGGDKSVKPIKVCKQGSWIQKLGGNSSKTKELRSETPMGFAYAFFKANSWNGSEPCLT